MRHRTANIFSFVLLHILMTSLVCATGWIDPIIIQDTTDCHYPMIAVDNVPVDFLGTDEKGYGRAHIVWSEKEGDDCKVFCRGVDYDKSLTARIEISREPIEGGGYLYYPSDEACIPSIVVDTNDDKADIAFCQKRPGWYFGNAVSEILFLWKAPLIFFSNQGEGVDASDQLFHLSGLQLGIKTPYMIYSGLKPTQRYHNMVFWSQSDDRASQQGKETIYYSFQQDASLGVINDVDWGDQSIASQTNPNYSSGDRPCAAVGFNRNLPDTSDDLSNMVVVVSIDEISKLKLSRSYISKSAQPHVWETFDIALNVPSEYEVISQSCAFDSNNVYSPPNDPPKLHIVSYVHLTSQSTWRYYYQEVNPWLTTPSVVSQVEVGIAPASIDTRPVIKTTDKKYAAMLIAFIDENQNVMIKEGPDGTPTPIPNAGTCTWVDLAVDNVSVGFTGFCPQIVYLETSPSPGIHYTRYFKSPPAD